MKPRVEEEDCNVIEPIVEIIEGEGEIDFASNPYFDPPVLVENPFHEDDDVQKDPEMQQRRRKFTKPRRDFGPNQPRRQNGQPYVQN